MPVPAVELEVGNRTVRVTSPDKIYFPEVGLTKLDIVSYVIAVGNGIFAALKDRPVTMERWPGGYRPDVKLSTRSDSHGEAFYQKRAPSKGVPDWVETVTITFPSGRTADEVCATELATIAWMANLGTLRYHPWPVTKADTEKVDQLRIDLDPQPGTDLVGRQRLRRQPWMAWPPRSARTWEGLGPRQDLGDDRPPLTGRCWACPRVGLDTSIGVGNVLPPPVGHASRPT